MSITSEIIDLILAGADGLKQFTQAIGSQLQGVKEGEPIVVSTREIIRRVRAVLRRRIRAGREANSTGTNAGNPSRADT